MIQKIAYDIVCFLQDEESGRVATESLTSLSGLSHKVFKGGLKEAIEYVKTEKVRIICVDLSQHALLISSAEDLIEICPPETLIIIIGDKNDVGVFRDLMKRNVADYLAKPLNVDIFVRSLRTALKLETNLDEDRHKRVGKTIMFLGSVGGIGATTIATNCAYILAEELGKQVALVDADFQFGNVVTLLDLKPSHALFEAVSNTSRVDDMFLENSMALYGKRLRVLTSEEPLHESLMVESEEFLDKFDELLDIISRKFHYVIIDISKHHPSLWRALSNRADRTFLVSGLNIASLRDTMKILQTLNEGSSVRLASVIVNRVREKESIGLEKFKELLGHPIEAVISHDSMAPVSADLGEPLVKQRTHFNQDLDKVIEIITGVRFSRSRSSALEKISEFFSKFFRWRRSS